MKCVAFIGPPGCGKGTQAALLTQRGYLHISTGDMLRSERDSESTLGRIINEYLSTGAYVPDAIVTELLKQNLSAASAFPDKVIFDGYPRTVGQLELLSEMLGSLGIAFDLSIIHITVDEEELFRRMTARNRADDAGLLDERLRVYTEQTVPVLHKAGELYPVFNIDGNRSISDIAADILDKVEDTWSDEAILAVEPGQIFATGLTTDDAYGCNMTGSGKALRWVAKRGDGDDWAVYCHWAEHDVQWVAENGDKVMSRVYVNALVLCTDAAFKLYRR